MIAVCGECLIDFIPQTADSSSSHPTFSYSKKVNLPNYCAYIGGSPLNTAVATSRLSTPTTMISRLSRDAFGKAIVKHLTLNEVKTKTLVRGDEPTTIGFVIPKKNRGEDFVFYAQRSADRFFQIKDLPKLPSTVDHLHFSSIALQMEPCGLTYEYLMKKEFRRRTISIDPNVRPLFIKDKEVYRKRIKRMAKMVGVFRASDQDLKYLYPRQSPATTIKKIIPLLRAPQIAVLTQGSKGATVFYLDSQIKTIHATIKKTKTVDTVGAGDSFTGAFLHTLHQHGLIGKKNPSSPKTELSTIIKQALDFSIRAATINCSRQGCDPAFITELK